MHEVKNENEQAIFGGNRTTVTSGINTPTLYAEENAG